MSTITASLLKSYCTHLHSLHLSGLIPKTSYRVIYYTLTSLVRDGAITMHPVRLLEHLAERKAAKATIQAAFTHVIALVDWLVMSFPKQFTQNPYRNFRFANKRKSLFRGTDTRRFPQMSYEEARNSILITPLMDTETKNQALFMLENGLRFSESLTYNQGHVTQKGSTLKRIKVPHLTGQIYSKSYASMRRSLKLIGLKTHDLRKLFATKQAMDGKSVFEIRDLLGHSSIETSQYYVDWKSAS